MPEMYSTVCRPLTNKLNSQSNGFEITRLKQLSLSLNTFVIHNQL